MSTKPRRLDWTLSATPTRRGVRVFLVAAIPSALLGGCILTFLIVMGIARGPRAPERSFTALDFFPPASAYPADYEVVQAPRWAGEDSPIVMGDGNDAYSEYRLVSATSIDILMVVFYQSHWNSALNQYQTSQETQREYGPINEVAFQSQRAQEWILRCAEPETPHIWRRCGYTARYDEFVIELSAGVGPYGISVPEFEDLLRAVDQRAIELLGPMPTPTP